MIGAGWRGPHRPCCPHTSRAAATRPAVRLCGLWGHGRACADHAPCAAVGLCSLQVSESVLEWTIDNVHKQGDEVGGRSTRFAAAAGPVACRHLGRHGSPAHSPMQSQQCPSDCNSAAGRQACGCCCVWVCPCRHSMPGLLSCHAALQCCPASPTLCPQIHLLHIIPVPMPEV